MESSGISQKLAHVGTWRSVYIPTAACEQDQDQHRAHKRDGNKLNVLLIHFLSPLEFIPRCVGHNLLGREGLRCFALLCPPFILPVPLITPDRATNYSCWLAPPCNLKSPSPRHSAHPFPPFSHVVHHLLFKTFYTPAGSSFLSRTPRHAALKPSPHRSFLKWQ